MMMKQSAATTPSATCDDVLQRRLASSDSSRLTMIVAFLWGHSPKSLDQAVYFLRQQRRRAKKTSGRPGLSGASRTWSTV